MHYSIIFPVTLLASSHLALALPILGGLTAPDVEKGTVIAKEGTIKPKLNVEAPPYKLEGAPPNPGPVIKDYKPQFYLKSGPKKRGKDTIAQLRVEVEAATSNNDIEKLEERIAKLCAGVAVIRVGALTEIEMKEKKARLEDALSQCK